MKILMVLDREFPPDTRVENEIKSLIQDGHQVHIACFTFKNRAIKEDIDGLTVHRKPISKLIFKSSVAALKLPLYFNFWRRFLKQIFLQESFDAIHIHDLPLAKVGVEFKNRYGLKLVIDLHENYPAAMEEAVHTNTFLGKLLSSNKKWRNYEKDILRHADLIIAVIEEMKDRIAALGINRELITIVPNTLDESNFIVSDKSPDSNYITLFYAGGINIHRGLQIAIQGINLIQESYPQVRLWVIGAGSYIKALQDLTSELGLQKQVKFFGWKNLDEIADIITESNISIIPHLKSEQTDNSSPNKLYQYMYAGKAILTSNCNSITRIVKDSKAGMSYQFDSPKDMAEKLVHMLDEDKVAQYGANGNKTASKKYLWKYTVQNMLEKYRQFN